ncbi:MAG TPA: DUF6599 family protein [Verrucomicrobiae bacterium]|nr:DUF6599 family protein [Verrucomicrobiae bacterium]
MTHSSRNRALLLPALSWLALAVALGIMLLLCFACQRPTASASSLFPDSAEAPGWSKAPEVRTFSADKLSDYIDGDAEKYLKAGVRSTSTADYKFRDKLQATADVYTFSSPDGAKAILESEPAMDAQTPALGDAARLFAQSLTFRKGPYLVRIVAYQDSPELAPALLKLGQAIGKKLPR